MAKLVLMSILLGPVAIGIWTAGMPSPVKSHKKMIRYTFLFYLLWVKLGPMIYFAFPPAK